MPLPDLPKQHKKKEADFGITFRHWWERRPFNGNFELKHTRGESSLPFSAVESEQIVVANAASGNKGILLRLVKGTIGSSDYIGQVLQQTYIVIRYPKFFCLITFEAFMAEKSRSQRKSLTSERAREISKIIVENEK